MPYTLSEHRHLVEACAANRAASDKGILEEFRYGYQK
jgi:hypothetical protein